jgi:pimeloyl-ACP methyl ester carboxylesterase
MTLAYQPQVTRFHHSTTKSSDSAFPAYLPLLLDVCAPTMLSRLYRRPPTPVPPPLAIKSHSTHPHPFHPLDSEPREQPQIKIAPLLIIAMAALTLLLVVLLAFFSPVHSVLIPGPDADHKYQSAVAEFPLVDTTRKDPHLTDSDRRIMVSLFMPVLVSDCTNECSQAYMGPLAARIANNQTLGDPNIGVFENMAYAVCCGASKPIDASRIPVVVLEPHTDTSRLLYSNLARYMTANNVAVVLLDHPYDSSIVEFSDTDVVLNSGATGLSNLSPLTAWNATVTNAMYIRIQDISMALAQLNDINILTRNFPGFTFSSPLNTSSYSIVGHGLGGTVATYLSIADPHRVRFSINLSGSAPPLDHTTSSPIYFFGRANFRRDQDINWRSTWTQLTGPATEFDLADSEILDFTDLPIVIDTAGISGLKGAGLGNSGPWGNHAVRCFVEGVIKDRLNGETGGVSHCVQVFEDRMVPYMAKDAGIRPMEMQSVGVSRRMAVGKASVERRATFRKAVRGRLEDWGFL